MDDPNRWRQMASAPKDGSRILVTIRPSEQGPAEVDLAYWSNGDQFGAEGWRASDSSPGRIVEYAEPELKCWMPMPSANLDRTSMPPPWEGEDTRPHCLQFLPEPALSKVPGRRRTHMARRTRG